MGNRNPRLSLLSHPVTCYSAKSAGDAVSLKIKLGGEGGYRDAEQTPTNWQSL